MCETMQIAVNSVINWIFFIFAVFLYFQVFISTLKVAWNTWIRRLDMWRHRARDHSTRHRPLPTYLWSFGTKPISPAVFEILAFKRIGVKILTFQGHVTTSVMWPFDSQVAIFYRRSIVTKTLSPAIFEVMGTKHTCHDLDLSGSRDINGHVNDHVTIWFPGCHFL